MTRSGAAGVAEHLDPAATTAEPVTPGVAQRPDAPAGLRAWAALAEAAAEDNVFFHPDFALPAMASFGHGRVRVATVADGARLLAVAPYTAARLGRVTPAVRLWSHPFGPLGVPLLDAERPEEGAERLLERLSPSGSNVAVVVPDLPLDGPVAALLAYAARATRRSATIIGNRERAVAVRVAGTYRASLSKHRKREFARLLRRLSEQHHVEMEVVADPEGVLTRFDEFLTLEDSGWKGEGHSALASDKATGLFAVEAVTARANAGAIRVHALRVDGAAIASMVSFLCGKTAYTWKIAYDERFAHYSPGAQVMVAAVPSLLAEPGIARVDSCAGPNHTLVDPLLADRMAMGTFVISPPRAGARYAVGLTLERLTEAAMTVARRVRRRLR